MKKLRILIPIGSRSDKPLTEDIIKKLTESDWCEWTTIPLSPANYINSYKIIEKHLSLCNYDLVLCAGDRIEMTGCAAAVYHSNTKIIHLGAGIIDYSFVLFDDMNRHVITLYSDIVFCEDTNSAMNVVKLWNDIGKVDGEIFFNMDYDKILKDHNIYIVGNFYIDTLESLEIDESLVPEEEYDLVLINPTTTKEEVVELVYLNPKKLTIFIQPNQDSEKLLKNFEEIKLNALSTEVFYDNLPRPQFLGLLKRCSRYITNSSNMYYEAEPLGLKPEQIIQVGARNKERTTPKDLPLGGPSRVVELLKEYWEVNVK